MDLDFERLNLTSRDSLVDLWIFLWVICQTVSITSDQSYITMYTLRGHKEAYPTPLEAILRTERALFPKLKTCWTL